MKTDDAFRYPRRRVLRAVLRRVAQVLLATLSDFHIVGRENIPERGPLLVVANHFSYIDPVAMVRTARWPIEFIGGFRTPNAPAWTALIPKLWGFLPVFRGTGSRHALQAAEAVLSQGGVLGIFPEGGSWAKVLRPARPGAAFLAARTGTQILPMGFDGLIDIFPSLQRRRRACVTLRAGKPFGPFHVTGRGRERRRQLDEIGHEIMRHIAELLPPERRGHYSDDPAIRAAAAGTEIYPWADAVEEDFRVGQNL
ncbi:MAG: 1-acyl-sn-glycerol-3-phosphate acyltransferase [Anaerolineae bacterium]|nr:1-acyl-sn-glycerol-3-phosphate acyltransferase [Anaerolineae bacterium]